MLKARPDWKNPQASSGAMPVGMIGSRSADRIRAAVRRTANAVHMTAPAEDRLSSKKSLQQGSHPHMTVWNLCLPMSVPFTPLRHRDDDRGLQPNQYQTMRSLRSRTPRTLDRSCPRLRISPVAATTL